MYLNNAFKWEIFTQGQWGPRYALPIRSILCLKPIFASIKWWYSLRSDREQSHRNLIIFRCAGIWALLFLSPRLRSFEFWLELWASIDWQPDWPDVSKPGQDRTVSYSSKLPLDRGSERLFRLPFSICRWIALPGSARAHTFNYTAHLHFNCRQTRSHLLRHRTTIVPPGAETRWHCGWKERGLEMVFERGFFFFISGWSGWGQQLLIHATLHKHKTSTLASLPQPWSCRYIFRSLANKIPKKKTK